MINLSRGTKSSEFVVVAALILSNFFGLDMNADNIKDIIAQAHGNEELIYLGIAYVIGRSWIKSKEAEKQEVKKEAK